MASPAPSSWPGALQPELAHAALQPAQHVAQLALAVAERTRLVAVRALAILPLTLALTLATLPLLALLPLLTLLPALTLLAALSTLALLPLLALLAEGVVEQLLLTADDVAELVHHLAHALVLALVGHAARLQPVEQVAQLAQHLLGHVAVAGARHVLEVAQHLLEILRGHELVVAVQPLHRRRVLRLLGELLEELRQRLTQLLHELLDLLVGGALLERLLQPVLGRAQGALGVRQVAVLDAQRDVPELGDDAVARRRASRRS